FSQSVFSVFTQPGSFASTSLCPLSRPLSTDITDRERLLVALLAFDLQTTDTAARSSYVLASVDPVNMTGSRCGGGNENARIEHLVVLDRRRPARKSVAANDAIGQKLERSRLSRGQ